jgi:hypothetical protein
MIRSQDFEGRRAEHDQPWASRGDCFRIKPSVSSASRR